MRIVLGPSESLTAVMSGAAATTNPTYLAEYAEVPDGSISTQNTGSLSGATAVTLVSAPSAGKQCLATALSIYNADTSAVTVTLSKVSGGTSYPFMKQIIPVAATLLIDSAGVSVQQTDGSTLSFGTATTITFTGATGTNIIAAPDNLASALTIKEGSTAYFTVVTTDSAEKIDIAKDLLLSGGSDLTFTGTTGQPQINLTTNLADALSIVDTGVGDLIVFTTTTGSQAIVVTPALTSSTSTTTPIVIFNGATGANEIRVPDNLADALSIEGTHGDLITFTTTDNAEAVNIASRLKIGAGSTLTIASGAVTCTGSYHLIAGEGASADDLATINGGVTGQILSIAASSDSVTITAVTSGNIVLGDTSRVLDNANDTLTLIYNGTKWCEIGFASNGT